LELAVDGELVARLAELWASAVEGNEGDEGNHSLSLGSGSGRESRRSASASRTWIWSWLMCRSIVAWCYLSSDLCEPLGLPVGNDGSTGGIHVVATPSSRVHSLPVVVTDEVSDLADIIKVLHLWGTTILLNEGGDRGAVGDGVECHDGWSI